MSSVGIVPIFAAPWKIDPESIRPAGQREKGKVFPPIVPMITVMDTKKKGSKPPKAKEFKPRRSFDRPADEAEVRGTLKVNVPASLVKDIHLYAVQADRSVADVVATILRRAIPRLEVVTVTGKMIDCTDDRGLAQLEEHVIRGGDDAGSSPAPATLPISSKMTA